MANSRSASPHPKVNAENSSVRRDSGPTPSLMQTIWGECGNILIAERITGIASSGSLFHGSTASVRKVRESVVMIIVVKCGERNFGRNEKLSSSSLQFNSCRWRGRAAGVPSEGGSTSRVIPSERFHSQTSSRRIHEAYLLRLLNSRKVGGRCSDCCVS